MNEEKLVTYQGIEHGEVQAVEPIVQGQPLGLGAYEDKETILEAMATVLNLASVYGGKPTKEGKESLLKAAEALHTAETKTLLSLFT